MKKAYIALPLVALLIAGCEPRESKGGPVSDIPGTRAVALEISDKVCDSLDGEKSESDPVCASRRACTITTYNPKTKVYKKTIFCLEKAS
jgi:hypothetical protein